ncbi:unnamed protein product [Sphenostylis stenocarpa]|uniref:Uncharacterized protein n=1 Tax=Sphenostylis stenocarpa TaxID=92480 RepID=A0AA86SQS0_9FABA|nr:unnamed protein product [Sphenostylis stenocarpa]
MAEKKMSKISSITLSGACMHVYRASNLHRKMWHKLTKHLESVKKQLKKQR